MKIAFFSNFLNHHQMPLANSFLNLDNIDYSFIVTEKIPDERLKLGYKDENDLYSFVTKTYESKEELLLSYDIAYNADIVVVGSASDSYMDRRLNENKITFHSSERYFKKGITIKTFPRYFLSAMKHIKRYEKKPLHYLCMSAYTAADVNMFCNYEGRMFKWGYFPECVQYNECELLEKKKNLKLELLWVGRFIEWKHPEYAIRLAQTLNYNNVDFQLTFIGIGPLLDSIKTYCKNNGLDSYVRFLGSMPPEQVRENMLKSNIFLFTSDYNEGWGAVLNEAMNSGCTVVASHAIGSVPYLIKDGVNGFVYQNGSQKELEDIILNLVKKENRSILDKVGIEAYSTITNEWNSNVAAKRLIELYEALCAGKESPYDEGPCSIAKPIKNSDMYDLIKKGQSI